MPLLNQSLLYRRYRILAELGRGGMGAVYRAHDENLGVDVAIKENLFVSPEFAQQFRREATLLASLRHPSLPRVTDHFVIADQGQYLVMDFVPGEDARHRLVQNNGPLPEAEVLRWARDLLDALIYLHGRPQPVIHRDIKPGNIKITPEGRAVLVDFGLAKVHDDAQATAAGAKGLSPGYSPPEQYGAGRTDGRSDLYALGASLYALLSGQPPPDAFERALRQTALVPLRELNLAVSPATAAAIEQALALKPEARFLNAAAFLAALVRDDRTTASHRLPALPLTPPPPTHPPRPTAPAVLPPLPPPVSVPLAASPPASVVPPAVAPPARRFPWGPVISVGLFVAVALAGGALWAVSQLARPAATATPPPLTVTAALAADTATAPPAATATPPAATGAPTAAPSLTVAPAADTPTSAPAATDTPLPTDTPAPVPTPIGGGSGAGAIAFVSERGDGPQIFLMDADGGNITQVTHVAEGACQPAWSPDGQSILFVTPCVGKRERYPGSSIYIIQADGTGLRPFITLLGGEWDPAWSSAGVAFVFNDNGRPQIYLADAQGANAQRLSNIHSGDTQPAWSGDGLRLAFRNNSRSGQPTIYWMFADGTFAGGGANPDAVTRDVESGFPAWSPDSRYVAYMVGSDIWIAGWDQVGFGALQLTSAGPNGEPAWSPDSQWLVFESWRDAAQHDLYRMSFTGAQVTRLNNDAALDYQPAWRP